MPSLLPAALLLLSGLATGAAAQGPSRIPVQEDLRRLDSTEQRIEAGPDRRRPPGRTATPADPSGVPGFDEPPGTVGDGVGSDGALPPGGPGNESR